VSPAWLVLSYWLQTMGELCLSPVGLSAMSKLAPVRIAGPAGIGGLVDTIQNPGYSTAVGLLQWGASTLAEDEPMRYESAPAMGGLGRLRDALRSIFP